MTFERSLAAVAGPVERHLDWLLSSGRQADVPARLLAAMRHGVLGQGKRFRPFLVLESAALFDVAAERALNAAAALELVHCYSLVHDDLPAMDNDTLRRGAPTVWAAFDEWTAILAGDGLLALAFEVLSDPLTHADPAVRSALVAGLARASGPAGMVGGQVIDLEADKRGEPRLPTLAHIRRLQAMKTGALIRFGAECGAILGRASPDRRAALVRYGEALGLAFQVSDDLLDVEGDAAVVGKAVAKDAAQGKATLVGLLGIARARERLAATVAEAIDALAPFGAPAERLREAARHMGDRRK